MLAEDLTSVTFKRAWQSRHLYRNEISEFSTWLFAIARRVAADYFREQHSQGEISLEAATYSIFDDDTPESLAERHELIERVRVLIQQLPEREQELIALKYGAGMAHQQIMSITGLSASNVRVLLHRAIQKLRDQMKVNDELAR